MASTLPIHRKFVRHTTSDPVRSVLGWVQGETDVPPVVFERGRPIGVPEARRLVEHHLNVNERLERCTVRTPVLGPRTKEEEALALFGELGVGHLPFMEDGTLRGVVRLEDILARYDDGPDAHTAALWIPCLQTDQTVRDAADAFMRHRTTMMPVIEPGGRVVGRLHLKEIVNIAIDSHGGRGRKDRNANLDDLYDMPIESLIDGYRRLHVPSTPYREIVHLLRREPAVLVTDRHGARGAISRRAIGVVTATSLAHAMHESHSLELQAEEANASPFNDERIDLANASYDLELRGR